MRSLEGRTALVTGASRGLGREIALTLAQEGAVVAALARDRSALESTMALLPVASRGPVLLADLTDESSVNSAVGEALSALGSIDILINNAGVASERPSLEVTVDEIRGALDVNVLGTWAVTRAVAASMASGAGGSIVNVASVMAFVSTPGLLAYGASKAAIVQMTRILAVEWARHGIRVNCIAPGYFPTEINADRLAEEHVSRALLRRIPMRRFGEIPEIGPLVAYLASPASAYMTGQIVSLDGGMSIP